MSASVKDKPRLVGQEASAKLFGELKDMFSMRTREFDARVVAMEVKKTVGQLGKSASFEEILILQEVVKNLASELDAFVSDVVDHVSATKLRGGATARRITAADLDAIGEDATVIGCSGSRRKENRPFSRLQSQFAQGFRPWARHVKMKS